MHSSLSIRHMCGAALVFVLVLAAKPAFPMAASEVFEIASKSTVVVKKLDANGKTIGLGSGVVLPGGDIATNCHVVEGAEKISVRSSGKDYPAILRHSDWDRDVCSISAKSTKQNTPVILGSTKKLMVGKPVYAIGSPKGLELTLSDGIVSSLREVEDGKYIQTTAAISPGSSGGGLFDENGALVGLTTFYIADGQSLNFALPVEWVNELPKRHRSNNISSQSAPQWLNKSIELYVRKDKTALIKHSLLWTRTQPHIADAWYSLGIAYGESGETVKEIESYQKAISINSKHADAWINLGHSYKSQNQTSKAIECTQQAIRINPELDTAWFNLGTIYAESGKTAQGIESLLQAIRINPEYAKAWDNLGLAYKLSGEPTKAIESYQQATRISPELSNVWNNLGNIYNDSGQIAKAIEALLQATRIDPENSYAWYNLGRSYKISGQTSKVTEVYKSLKVMNPAMADNFFNKFVMP